MKGITAGRMEALHPNYFTRLGERIAELEREGKHVIRLDIGSPDLPPPGKVISRLGRSSADPNKHGYQSHRGTPELRQAWAAYYRRHYGVGLDPGRQILPLIGSKEGIFHLSLVLIGEGDVVLVPDPGYQTYAAGARFCGGIAHPVNCFSGDDFLGHLTGLPGDVLDRAKVIWANFPHNPTGATVELGHLRTLVDLAREHDILLCHDAPYTRVTYEGYRAPSLLEVEGAVEVGVEFNSLSKSHNMAGWRMGVVAGNAEVIHSLYRLKTHADSGQFLPVLEAGAGALEDHRDWIEERNTRYRRRRDMVIEALRTLGIDARVPRGGIYVWFPVPGNIPSEKVARFLVDNVQLALTPGTVFGSQGEGFLRLSLTSPVDEIREGMERLSRGVSKIR